ncbi:amino acid adenylation domain-containing protein [Actinokineospora pegani]|uniref:amino acid adenylation domain-containing protein n=1 Tax=Actinokineospora pegani TaxID=2654637 RepID=UPI0012EA5190|nr:amino acid adenylation domain-containing protein [Actinokineospora pegani]
MTWMARVLLDHARLRARDTALVADDTMVSYGELARRVGAAAGEMRRRGVLDGDVVVVGLPRGVGQVVAALAAMWVGAAFAVVDVEEAAGRRRAQVLASSATWAVGDVGADGVEVLRLPGGEDSAAFPAAAETRGDDAAYVVFTSGTTGDPKAVAVPRRALANYAHWFGSVLDRVRSGGAPLSCASVTSFATDLGHTAIFPALIAGDSVHLVGRSTMMDPIAFGRYMRAHAIDVLKSTPSHMAVHVDAGAFDVLPRRLMVFGGEPLPWGLVDRVRAHGGCRVLNHYGPSETTIGVLTYPVEEGAAEHRSCAHVPLGTPIGGVSAAVVDEDLRAVAPGETGELVVWGECVALGYLGAPAATRERFVRLPGRAGRAYRTGDTARGLASGDIEFLGRGDRQVKVHGQRIELGEVEAALRRCPGVGNAVVSHSPDTGLHAHVVAAEPQAPPDGRALRRLLRESLPVAAIPRGFTVLAEIPLTLSGKLDTARLARPQG